MTAGQARASALRQLQECVGGELIGPPDATITGIASLEQAGPGDLAFLASERSVKTLQSASDRRLARGPRLPDFASPQLVVDNPAYAFALAAQHFFVRPTRRRGHRPGKSSAARMSPSARMLPIWPG